MAFSRRERILIALNAAILIFIFIGGHSLPEVNAKDSGKEDIYSQLKVFTDVLSIVKRDYVKEIDAKPLVEGAIKGMLGSLDPHSGYLDPDFYQDLQVQTKGEFGGLGLEITIKDGLLVVVSPMDGSPAALAGIRPGDSIVKIDGKYTKDFSLVDAVKRLRGPKGSSITLTVHRKGRSELFDVVVVRDNITVKSIRSRFLGDGFGYVRLNQFMESSADDLQAALSKLRKENNGEDIQGLILDLRNNPGGLLTQAIRIADLFLTDGVIVYTDGRVEGQKQKFYAHPRGTEPNYPMVIIVNGGSASASEIIAGAFKDHGRALILGTKTFGKGSVQTITPLENGGALSLTTALYYTKSGQSIQLTGVKPDIEMEAPLEEPDTSPENTPQDSKRPEYIREGDLPGAISNPSGRSDEPAMNRLNKIPSKGQIVTALDPEREPLDSLYKRDPILARGLELLKTFNIFHPETATTASDSTSQAQS